VQLCHTCLVTLVCEFQIKKSIAYIEKDFWKNLSNWKICQPILDHCVWCGLWRGIYAINTQRPKIM